MPEYLAPGVFVEEVSFRAKSIEGVSTTTTGFVGATRYGPIDLEPDIITSLVEYERVYGGKARLDFDDTGGADNYLWNGVRAFFEEGGKRCYVARAFHRGDTPADEAATIAAACAHLQGSYPPANVRVRARHPGKAGAGRVSLQMRLSQNRLTISNGAARLSSSATRDVVAVNGLAVAANDGLYLLVRDVQAGTWTFDNGLAGAARVSFELQALAAQASARVQTLTASVSYEPSDSGLPFFGAAGLALDTGHTSGGEPDSIFDYFAAVPASLSRARTLPIIIEQQSVASADAAKLAADARLATATSEAVAATAAAGIAQGDFDAAKLISDQAVADAVAAEAAAAADPADPVLAQDALDARADADAKTLLTQAAQASLTAANIDKDAKAAAQASASAVAAAATTAAQAAAASNGKMDGITFARTFLVGAAATDRFTLKTLAGKKEDDSPRDMDLPVLDAVYRLDGGLDGKEPGLAAYQGAEDPTTNRSWGLKALEAIEDISIIAAPGSTANGTDALAIAGALISHAERMRYCIAVLDSVFGHSIADVRAYRGTLDSSHAAFYYPWVKVIDPLTGVENHYPPSGFVAGIYARNDIERAVYKAPANEVVRLAIGFEKMINKGQQEVLNPEGINCFRFFEGRGMRLWGARTISSDPEWKYVNLRRYFAYLERSIDKGTQWAVFEPNGELLWANVRSTIADFLLNEWQNGALLGEKPERSFFVKCDRSTMSQNDLDNGRLVCLIGVAPLRPAEFVIFRIGQWTADRKI
ncbi:phage tail sheath subtilisin-like domain-containing protein [Sandarakinorhabdus sp.]|uniref:phage tail sheath family protein n=1 Tax=Sandarakinorhabdus sp. TaxID=1916663 RepID=UPI00286DD20A|nr:phage tail sheath subtilisin-like domain-containing protein [Sandarakinorhabdus sp.]